MFEEVIEQDRLTESDKFKTFVEKYKGKVRGKVEGAKKDINESDEKLKDVQFELDVAYLLCKNSFFIQIEYEKYENEQRNPDFTILDEAGMDFNVEVKRIREANLEKRFKKWELQVIEEVYKIPSKTLVFTIRITDKKGRENSYEPDLLDRLENRISDIVKGIHDLIPQVEKVLPIGEDVVYPIPNFENEVKVKFSKPYRRKASDFVLCRSFFERPVFYKQDDYDKQGEYRKFGDTICDGVGQMRPDMINVLAINSRSETHDDVDLAYALSRLKNLAIKQDDKFFKGKKKSGKRLFSGANDFWEQFKRLSGILFINQLGTQEDCLLRHNEDANYPIPKSIENALLALLA